MQFKATAIDITPQPEYEHVRDAECPKCFRKYRLWALPGTDTAAIEVQVVVLRKHLADQCHNHTDLINFRP